MVFKTREIILMDLNRESCVDRLAILNDQERKNLKGKLHPEGSCVVFTTFKKTSNLCQEYLTFVRIFHEVVVVRLKTSLSWFI